MSKEFNDGLDMGAELEQETEVLNRNELMKLTGKELAKMAQPYSTLRLVSLERMSKAKLCDIILNKTDKKKEDDEKPNARAARSTSETEQFIDTALTMLDMLKRNRDHEPLNPVAKDIFKKQAVVYADEKIKNNELDVDKANTALFTLAGAAILYDGIIGFKNTPTLLNKIKNKFFNKGKKASSEDDTK